MDALEQEVLRLRAEGDRLNQVATNWKKCAVALVNSRGKQVLNIHHISQFGPGIFLWSVSSSDLDLTIADPAFFMSHEYQWQAYSQQALMYPSLDMIPHINIEDASEEFLLRNCKPTPNVLDLMLANELLLSLRKCHSHAGRDGVDQPRLC